MKSFKVGLFLALLGVGCLPAFAQSQIPLDIPFNFFVEGKSLPAGHYNVTQAFDRNAAGWTIFSRQSSAMMLTHSVQSPQKAHRPGLVFWHTGDGYALVPIWSSEHSGRELPLKTNVKTTMLTKGEKDVNSGQCVEIAAH